MTVSSRLCLTLHLYSIYLSRHCTVFFINIILLNSHNKNFSYFSNGLIEVLRVWFTYQSFTAQEWQRWDAKPASRLEDNCPQGLHSFWYPCCTTLPTPHPQSPPCQLHHFYWRIIMFFYFPTLKINPSLTLNSLSATNPILLLFLTIRTYKKFYKGSWLPYLLFSLQSTQCFICIIPHYLKTVLWASYSYIWFPSWYLKFNLPKTKLLIPHNPHFYYKNVKNIWKLIISLEAVY